MNTLVIEEVHQVDYIDDNLVPAKVLHIQIKGKNEWGGLKNPEYIDS